MCDLHMFMYDLHMFMYHVSKCTSICTKSMWAVHQVVQRERASERERARESAEKRVREGVGVFVCGCAYVFACVLVFVFTRSRFYQCAPSVWYIHAYVCKYVSVCTWLCM